MSAALQTASAVCVVLGLLSATAVLLRRAGRLAAVGVLLEFLLAAGLLRLADDPTWRQLAAAAVVVGLRRLLTAGMRRHHVGTAGAGRGVRAG